MPRSHAREIGLDLVECQPKQPEQFLDLALLEDKGRRE
jgi:hypothetical protein